MRKHLVPAALAAAALAVAIGVPVSGGAAAPPDLQVVESVGTAAVAGLVSRLPAESAGGAVFANTVINLDKARGTAAGFTGGNLIEIFFGTSSEDYRNPTLARSQSPPTASEGEEATAETSQSGAEGVTGQFATRSTGEPSSTATATAKTVAGEGLSLSGGRSASNGAVGADGTVLTEAVAQSASILVGGVVALNGVRSAATSRVAADGTPEAGVRTTVAEITVNGVGARLTSEGLELAEQPPFGAKELADFNAGLAQLKEQGIALAGVPAVVVEEPGRARATGAVAVVRYQVPVVIPNSIGNDEEILLAQVEAESIARRRPDTGPLPSLDLGGPEPAPAPPASPVAGPNRSAPPPGPVPTVVPAPNRPASRPLPATGSPVSGAVSEPPAPATSATPDPAAPASTESAAPDPFANRRVATESPSDRLRSGYGSFILAALAATALFLARQRTRLV